MSKKVNKYRFYIAWASGSDGACGDETGVEKPEDLIPQFKKKNPNVSSTIVYAKTIGEAYDRGYAWAFFENFTAADSCTICKEIK